ncbi:MAG TPA: IclR family transcriptional regulator [Pyrinomonadaceae bacterium]|nr:IclR family transcriptional regulator [Pyrinomonadaceae bacterium]
MGALTRREASEAGKVASRLNSKRAAVTSVERALTILELLAEKQQGLTTSEISRRAKIPKSSASYLLRTLAARGYLRRDPETGQFTPGIRMLSLGGQAIQGMQLRDVALPYLRQIAERTRLDSHLAVLDHGDAVYVERIESPGFIKMAIWVGKRVAPQVTAIGKALICYLERYEIQEIVGTHQVSPVSAKTIVSLPHLLEELAVTRQRGYAFDDEEHALGVRCIAAPVVAASGEVVAAIGVSGTVSQINDDYVTVLGNILRTTAIKFSGQLGNLKTSRR